jgi:Trehalase
MIMKWSVVAAPAMLLVVLGASAPAGVAQAPLLLRPAADAIRRAEQSLLKNIDTEDPVFTAFVRDLLRKCLLDKLWEPNPPGLPNRWFSISGKDDDSYGKCQLLWDTMFILNAYAALDDDALVRDVFRNYWAAIDHNEEAPKGSYRYGMVPGVINPTLPPVGYSQTPILAWGALMVYRQTNDRALLEEALPYLLAYDRWYSTERDVDQDGLIEQGAYKPTKIGNILQTAKFESFDFHPAVDGMKLTRHPTRPTGGEWYGNVEGVDTTCELLLSERALVEIARELGQEPLARQMEETVQRRITAIRARMWDPGTKFFYSVDRDTHEQIRVRTIQAFWTLTTGAATTDQAAALVGALKDSTQWWSRFPIPTVAMDDPKFKARGFWRGDMWPPTNYLVALGLLRYGYYDVAAELTERMLTLLAEKGVNERYDGTTGDPLGVPNYCWTALVWNMAVHARYGVQEDYRTIRVPARAKGRHLVLGKLEVGYPDDDAVELKTAFARRFRVVFPQGGGTVQVACDGRRLGSSELQPTGSRAEVAFDALPGKVYRVVRAPWGTGTL